MRNIQISVGEHYHVYNRGAQKKIIFHEQIDYARFLFLILFFQSPLIFDQVSRHVHYFVKHRVFDIDAEDIQHVVKNRYVELVAFCLMPNHFHLILKENCENGTARYMQRVLNGYTKYYNAKYEVSGHLLQGPYRAVHIEDNDQLLYLSTYIHRNAIGLSPWGNEGQKYEWSSYQDYVHKNRWGEILSIDLISSQFKKIGEYKEFVATSVAKSIDEILEF